MFQLHTPALITVVCFLRCSPGQGKASDLLPSHAANKVGFAAADAADAAAVKHASAASSGDDDLNGDASGAEGSPAAVRLGVVLPFTGGEVDAVQGNLAAWAALGNASCSRSAEAAAAAVAPRLVLYYHATADAALVAGLAPLLRRVAPHFGGGAAFLSAGLRPGSREDAYPSGVNAMFYRLMLGGGGADDRSRRGELSGGGSAAADDGRSGWTSARNGFVSGGGAATSARRSASASGASLPSSSPASSFDSARRRALRGLTHVLWMETDAFPLRRCWLDALAAEARVCAATGCWVRGSGYRGAGLDGAAADADAGGNWRWLSHVNGNALYALHSPEFARVLADVRDWRSGGGGGGGGSGGQGGEEDTVASGGGGGTGNEVVGTGSTAAAAVAEMPHGEALVTAPWQQQHRQQQQGGEEQQGLEEQEEDRPFDLALWEFMHNLPYNWRLHQAHAHQLQHTSAIANLGITTTSRDIAAARADPRGPALLHGRPLSAGALALRGGLQNNNNNNNKGGLGGGGKGASGASSSEEHSADSTAGSAGDVVRKRGGGGDGGSVVVRGAVGAGRRLSVFLAPPSSSTTSPPSPLPTNIESNVSALVLRAVIAAVDSVAAHLPRALEVVVAAPPGELRAYESALQRASALHPFAVRAVPSLPPTVEEEALLPPDDDDYDGGDGKAAGAAEHGQEAARGRDSAGGQQQRLPQRPPPDAWQRMWRWLAPAYASLLADMHCDGDFVLHLEAGDGGGSGSGSGGSLGGSSSSSSSSRDRGNAGSSAAGAGASGAETSVSAGGGNCTSGVGGQASEALRGAWPRARRLVRPLLEEDLFRGGRPLARADAGPQPPHNTSQPASAGLQLRERIVEATVGSSSSTPSASTGGGSGASAWRPQQLQFGASPSPPPVYPRQVYREARRQLRWFYRRSRVMGASSSSSSSSAAAATRGAYVGTVGEYGGVLPPMAQYLLHLVLPRGQRHEAEGEGVSMFDAPFPLHAALGAAAYHRLQPASCHWCISGPAVPVLSPAFADFVIVPDFVTDEMLPCE